MSLAEEIKEEARYQTQRFVRNGYIEKQPCEQIGCGVLDVDAHHPNYSKPLEVVWLCRTHHAETHKYLRRQARLTRAKVIPVICDTPWCTEVVKYPNSCTLDGRYKTALQVCQKCHHALHRELVALTNMERGIVV